MRVHCNDNFGAYLPKVTLRHTIYYICDKNVPFLCIVWVSADMKGCRRKQMKRRVVGHIQITAGRHL